MFTCARVVFSSHRSWNLKYFNNINKMENILFLKNSLNFYEIRIRTSSSWSVKRANVRHDIVNVDNAAHRLYWQHVWERERERATEHNEDEEKIMIFKLPDKCTTVMNSNAPTASQTIIGRNDQRIIEIRMQTTTTTTTTTTTSITVQVRQTTLPINDQ